MINNTSSSKQNTSKRILNNFSFDVVQRVISLQQQSSSMKKLHPKSKFTPEEDELLKVLVTKMINSENESQNSQNQQYTLSNEKENDEGKKERSLSSILVSNINWNEIALNMKTQRNARQCRERWLNYLSPLVTNGPWTSEEEELLRQKYNELGPRWKKISAFFPTRTDINVKSHYHLLERRIKKEEKKKLKAIQRQKELEEITQNERHLNNNNNTDVFNSIKYPASQINSGLPDIKNISSAPLPFFQMPPTSYFGNIPQFNNNVSTTNLSNGIENNNTSLSGQIHIQNNKQENQQQPNCDGENICLSPLPYFSFTAQEEEREFESNANECMNSLLMNDDCNEAEYFLEKWL